VKPYYSRGPVTLFHGDARDVLPTLTERGVVIFDPPYSEHTHAKSLAGARKSPLTDGNGRLSRCAISRIVEYGFGHLSASDRRFFAAQAARLAARWTLVFSDTESAHLWRRSLSVAGLDYARTGFWHKIGGTPQFTGDRPGTACEAITVCHPKGRKRWNGGGKQGLWEDTYAAGEALWYEALTVIDRGDGGAPRLHTIQKPEALMIALVADFSDPGEIVYDFTCGSGTTGIGCLRAPGGHRRFVGIEREEKWIEAATKRLDAELSGSTYHAAQAGQRALFAGVTR
jgi:site-specific DNA-methyltransferase (adenine-specific)